MLKRQMWLVMLSFASSGCYLVHERGPGSDGSDVGGRLDGGATDGRAIDSWSSVDANVLPPDPEPDGDLDEPLDAWIPDGAVPTRVVLTPADPVSIDDTPDRQGGVPSTVWNGAGWGVAWWATDVRLRTLDQDGVPVLPSELVVSGFPIPASVDFAIGRYAVTAASSAGTSLHLFDRALGRIATSATLPGASGADIARLEGPHQWIAVTRNDSTGHPVVVSTFDDALGAAEGPITLDITGPDSDVRVASLKTRAVVAWVTDAGLRAAVVRSTPLQQVGPTLELSTLPHVADREDEAVELEPLGNEVLVAVLTGETTEVYAVNPFMPSFRGPYVAGTTGITDRRAGIAPVPERRMFAVCWPRGVGPGGGFSSDASDGVSIRVFAQDGTPLSDELALVSGLVNIGGVDCGWNGTDFVVIWWRASQNNDLYSQRVHATFP